ncbi:hypothetical protein AB0G74_31105 [Streptomyces sp. NPDC020875]|uniref:hypothetical protein n=1 Tax=Streptomyces sp. NPDC020875 TaxID=3154898 RepID=UPI0033C65F29
MTGRAPLVALLSAATLALTVTAAAPPPQEQPGEGGPQLQVPLDHNGFMGPIVTVPAKGTVDTFVPCPSGTVPSGGGGGVTGQGSFISSSSPSGNGWALKASNITDTPKQAAAYAVCTAATHTRVAGSRVTVQGAGNVTAFADCPSGWRPSGGGFVTNEPFLSASRMDVDTNGRWRVDLANNDGLPHSASAFVVCTTVPVTIRQTSIVLQSGEQNHVTAVCLPGQRITGGGAHAPNSGTGVPPQPGVAINTNRGLPEPTGWGVHAKNHTDRPQELFIQAYCTTS